MRVRALVLLAVAAACRIGVSDEARLQIFGERLIAAGRSGRAAELAGATGDPDVARIDPALARGLSRLSAELEGKCGVTARRGEIRPSPGDEGATHHLFLVCEGERVLVIRFRFDPDSDRFRILNHWRP